MKWCLYRDLPLRPLYANGLGFQRPRLDDARDLWLFSSEARAAMLRKALRHDSGGLVHIGKTKMIRARMKTDFEENSHA